MRREERKRAVIFFCHVFTPVVSISFDVFGTRSGFRNTSAEATAFTLNALKCFFLLLLLLILSHSRSKWKIFSLKIYHMVFFPNVTYSLTACANGERIIHKKFKQAHSLGVRALSAIFFSPFGEKKKIFLHSMWPKEKLGNYKILSTSTFCRRWSDAFRCNIRPASGPSINRVCIVTQVAHDSIMNRSYLKLGLRFHQRLLEVHTFICQCGAVAYTIYLCCDTQTDRQTLRPSAAAQIAI